MATTQRESAADFPDTPGEVQTVSKKIRIEFGGQVVAETTNAVRIVEKNRPPVYYVPPEDVKLEYLVPEDKTSVCSFKGMANYWGVKVGDKHVTGAVWSYQDPKPGWEAIDKTLAFYPWMMDACFVGDLPVTTPQGDWYGGWHTDEVEGPWNK